MSDKPKSSLMGYARGMRKQILEEVGEGTQGTQGPLGTVRTVVEVKTESNGGGELSAIKSTRTKDMLLLDIKTMAQRNRQSQEKLQQSLEGLTFDTQQYELKIKAYLDQLMAREAKSKAAFRSKIEEMIRQYNSNKDAADEAKGRLLAELRDMRVRIKCLLAFLNWKYAADLNRLKAKMLQESLLAELFGKIMRSINAGKDIDKGPLAEKYRRDRQKRQNYSYMLDNWYKNTMDRLKEELERAKNRVVTINSKHKKKPKLVAQRPIMMSVQPTPDEQVIEVMEETVIVYQDETDEETLDDDPQPEIIIQQSDAPPHVLAADEATVNMQHVHMTINLQKEKKQSKCCAKHGNQKCHQKGKCNEQTQTIQIPIVFGMPGPGMPGMAAPGIVAPMVASGMAAPQGHSHGHQHGPSYHPPKEAMRFAQPDYQPPHQQRRPSQGKQQRPKHDPIKMQQLQKYLHALQQQKNKLEGRAQMLRQRQR